MQVVAQDDPRLGLVPRLRRRLPAGGVPPVATGAQRWENVDLFGAVEPTTGDRRFLALPFLHSARVQRWWDDGAPTCAASCHMLVLDQGAFPPATTLRWPPQVVAVPLPPYSPALHPLERRWRDRKDPLATTGCTSLAQVSETLGRLLQRYAHATLKSLTGFAYCPQAVETMAAHGECLVNA